MRDLPRVAVLICTYDRETEIIRTLSSLQQNLKYPPDRLTWFVCDDASPGGYVERLRGYSIVQDLKIEFVQQAENSGWGRNVTAGLIRAYRDAPHVFFCEDDYVLKRPLNLIEGVGILEKAEPKVGMVRYRGTAGTDLQFVQRECDISALDPSYLQAYGYVRGKLTYLDIDPNSPSLYIYSNGPHLKSASFHDWNGYYPRHLALGSTEEFYAHTVKDRMAGPYPHVAILPEWVPMWWEHIGVSYQLTDKDRLPSIKDLK